MSTFQADYEPGVISKVSEVKTRRARTLRKMGKHPFVLAYARHARKFLDELRLSGIDRIDLEQLRSVTTHPGEQHVGSSRSHDICPQL
jgi:hypothetical protein